MIESLVGLWVIGAHYDGTGGKLQGKVVGQPVPGHFLIQLYSWLDGEPTHLVLRDAQCLTCDGWFFYADAAEWIEAGRKLVAP